LSARVGVIIYVAVGDEAGVGGVTIVLNGRFSTRTDAQGFYSFPAVAAGTHQVEMVLDNLPLPRAILALRHDASTCSCATRPPSTSRSSETAEAPGLVAPPGNESCRGDYFFYFRA
jgi:hypothetical protein